MAVTIHVNGKSNSLVHKGSMGIAKCTVPDVCKTPSPGGPVPVPYPVIISMSSDLVKGTKTVKVDGSKMAAIKGSEFSRCTGDEPGTAGGVKSNTNMKEATWLLYSFDVKMDGKNACRLSDKMMMNHGNTVCLSGVNDIPVYGSEMKCGICGKASGHPIHSSKESGEKARERISKAQNTPKLNFGSRKKGFMAAALVCLDKAGKAVTLFQSSAGGVKLGFPSHPSGFSGVPKTAGGREIDNLDSYTQKGSNKAGACAGAKAILAASSMGFKPIALSEIWVGKRNKNFNPGKHAESCATCKVLLPVLLCDAPPED